MKKIFLVLVMCCCVCSLSAQDSLKVDAKTDMLTARVAQLEHDVDYLRCCYDIDRLTFKISDSSSSIHDNLNDLDIYIINKKHKKDYDILDVHINLYHNHQKLFNAYKSEYDVLKRYVDIIIETNVFRDDELEVINTSFRTLRFSIDFYEAYIEAYKSKILEYDSKKK